MLLHNYLDRLMLENIDIISQVKSVNEVHAKRRLCEELRNVEVNLLHWLHQAIFFEHISLEVFFRYESFNLHCSIVISREDVIALEIFFDGTKR